MPIKKSLSFSSGISGCTVVNIALNKSQISLSFVLLDINFFKSAHNFLEITLCYANLSKLFLLSSKLCF